MWSPIFISWTHSGPDGIRNVFVRDKKIIKPLLLFCPGLRPALPCDAIICVDARLILIKFATGTLRVLLNLCLLTVSETRLKPSPHNSALRSCVRAHPRPKTSLFLPSVLSKKVGQCCCSCRRYQELLQTVP